MWICTTSLFYLNNEFESQKLTFISLSKQPQQKAPIYVQCGVRVTDSSIKPDSTDSEDGKSLDQGLDVLDDALIRRFAYKLHRMLCGASQIIGIYFLAPPDTLRGYTSSFESILKTLMLDRTTTAKANDAFFLATVSLSTGAISALRYDFSEKNGSVTPEPMQIKVASIMASELVRVSTNWKLDLLLPVKRPISGDHEHRFQKTVTKVLTDEINKIEAAMVVDVESESVVGEDDEDDNVSVQLVKTGANLKLPDLVVEIESSKNGTSSKRRTKSSKVESSVESLPAERRYRLFSRHVGPNEANSFVVHQVASGALRIRGTIEGVAFVHRSALGSAAHALRLDLIKSLQSRVGLLFENSAGAADSSSFGEEDADKTTLGRAKSFSIALPRRVLLSSLVQQASFCDYILPSESLDACKSRFNACLGLEGEVRVEELEQEAGDSAWTSLELSDLPSDTLPTKPPQTAVSPTTSSSNSLRMLVIWAVIALLGIVLAVLFLPSSSISHPPIR